MFIVKAARGSYKKASTTRVFMFKKIQGDIYGRFTFRAMRMPVPVYLVYMGLDDLANLGVRTKRSTSPAGDTIALLADRPRSSSRRSCLPRWPPPLRDSAVPALLYGAPCAANVALKRRIRSYFTSFVSACGSAQRTYSDTYSLTSAEMASAEKSPVIHGVPSPLPRPAPVKILTRSNRYHVSASRVFPRSYPDSRRPSIKVFSLGTTKSSPANSFSGVIISPV